MLENPSCIRNARRSFLASMSILSAVMTARVPNLAFAVVGLFWGMFAAYVPEVKAQLGVNDATFGLLLLGQAIGLLSAMFLAPLFDRRVGARSMQVAGVLFALCWVLPGLITGPVAFVGAMLLLGTFSGLLDVVMNARVSVLEAQKGRTLMSASHGIFSLAYMVSAVMAAALRGAGVPPAVAFAMVGAVAVAISMTLHMAPPEDDAAEPQVGARTGGYPWLAVIACGLIVLTAFMSEATVETWSALHVERTLGGSAVEGALGPASLGLTMATFKRSSSCATTIARNSLDNRTGNSGATSVAAGNDSKRSNGISGMLLMFSRTNHAIDRQTAWPNPGDPSNNSSIVCRETAITLLGSVARTETAARSSESRLTSPK